MQLESQHRAGIADGCLYSDTASGKGATIRVNQIAERYNVSRTTICKVVPRRKPEVVEAQPVKKKL
ncbi:hypothetical protein KDX27_39345 [Burkholderia cenocepacia]|nr:hypothetical protein [Burkholderia cenocepacia]MBR8173748.1 hypothetical protein [Burkholderia cenocepacia]